MIGTLVIRVHYEFRGTRTGNLATQLAAQSLKMPVRSEQSKTTRNDVEYVEISKSVNDGELSLSESSIQSREKLGKLLPEVLGRIDHLIQRTPKQSSLGHK